MILKIRKNIHATGAEYTVRGTMGEVFCKITPLAGGYYIYDKQGHQLAQVTFGKKKKPETAMSVLSVHPSFPGAIRLAKVGNGFEFSPYVVTKEDKRFIKNIKGKKVIPDYSIWGDPSTYAYDLYEGNTILANIVPSSYDFNYFKVNLHENANFLWVLVIVLSLEHLS